MDTGVYRYRYFRVPYSAVLAAHPLKPHGPQPIQPGCVPMFAGRVTMGWHAPCISRSMNQTLETRGLERTASAPITRRQLLCRAGVFAAALATGCTPLRLALHADPEPFRGEGGVTDRALAAFVRSVAPRATGSAEELARVFADPAYPFARYRAFFAADLCRRAQDRFGTNRFDSLTEDARARIIEDGLHGDAVARRLYSGAIFLAQVAVYAGIYDDGRGARAINFDGANHGYAPETLTYPVPAWYLPAASSLDGNPN